MAWSNDQHRSSAPPPAGSSFLPGSGPSEGQNAEGTDPAGDDAKYREVFDLYALLGEDPPRINIAENDLAYAEYGAHTIERHSPDVQLRRGPEFLDRIDSTEDRGNVRTIEGRIYGDPPWPEPKNWSHRWIDHSTMNRTINQFISENWETIRSDLASKDVYRGIFDAGHLVGEGFLNVGMYGTGPRSAVYSRTSIVRLVIKLSRDEPPGVVVVTAFPLGGLR